MSNDPYGNTSVSPAGPSSQEAPTDQVLAIISLVLGILSIVSSCCCGAVLPLVGLVGVPLGIGAGITGFIALKKVKDGSGGGKGLAMTGMILGIVMTVLWVVGLIIFFLVFGMVWLVEVQHLQ